MSQPRPTRVRVVCLGVIMASLFGACSSSPPPVPPAAYQVQSDFVVVAEVDVIASITLPVGATIQFRLPAGKSHRPDGSPVLPPDPRVRDSTVLKAVAVHSCSAKTTCVDFQALSTGTAVITVPGVSGMICGNGGASGCVGVTASIYSIPVKVALTGRPAVEPRAGAL